MKLFYDCIKNYFIFRKQQFTNMCWVNNCCGYYKLRTGCISISVVNILLALAFLVLVLVVGRQSQYGSLYGESCSVPLYMVFPGTIVTIALWILLLIGVLKMNLALVIIHLVCLCVYFALLVIGVILIPLNGMVLFIGTPQCIVMAIGTLYILVEIGLVIYFSMVIIGFCQELRSGETGCNLPYPV